MFTSPQFKRRGRRKSCENSARTGGHAKSRLRGLEQLSRPLIPKRVLPASRRASTSWAVWETKQVTEGKAVPLRTHSFKRSLMGQPGQKRVPSLPSLRESHCPSETGGGVPAPSATLKCPKTQVTSVHKVADQSTNQSSSQACPWATSEAQDPVRLCEHRGRPARGRGWPTRAQQPPPVLPDNVKGTTLPCGGGPARDGGQSPQVCGIGGPPGCPKLPEAPSMGGTATRWPHRATLGAPGARAERAQWAVPTRTAPRKRHSTLHTR